MAVRFAPSPTGRLHVGNLRTAWVSHELAKLTGQKWVLRFEDIDLARNVPGAVENQLQDLKMLNLVPDQILIQTARRDRHFEIFEKAFWKSWVYPCDCSRKQIKMRQSTKENFQSAPHSYPHLYNGSCRSRDVASFAESKKIYSWRFRNADESGGHDFVVAHATLPLTAQSFLPAYHWACALDDWDFKYSILVRGFDLWSIAPLQQSLRGMFSRLEGKVDHEPAIFHAAMVTDNQGGRLEKRSQGVTLPDLEILGCSATRVADAFRKSFVVPEIGSFKEGSRLKESRESLSVEDLLYP